MITEEQIKKMCEKVGYKKLDGFETLEAYNIAGGTYTVDMIFRDWINKRGEILLNAMFALIEDGWRFYFNEDHIFTAHTKMRKGGVYIYYETSKLDALEQGIIYALENEK